MPIIKGSLRNKLILFLLIAIIVPSVTSIVITYRYTKETVRKNAIRENSNLIFQGKMNLINYLNIIDQASLVVYKEVKTNSIILNGYKDTPDQKGELIRTLQTAFRSVNEVYQVHLDIKLSPQHFLYRNELLKSDQRTQDEFTDKPFRSFQTYLESTHLSRDYGIKQYQYNPPEMVFSLHRPVYRIPDTELIGLMSIDVKLDFIQAICEQLFEKSSENIYVLDEQGNVVYSGIRNEWGKPLNEGWVSRILGQQGQKGTLEWKDGKFSGIEIFEKMETPYMNWTIVKQIPYDHLYRQARELTTINLAVFTLFLIIAIAATVWISIRFTRPIRKLIGYMNQIQTGNLDVAINVRSNDEIGILARRFRIMMQTINDLILREYSLELANKTNELKALQAQINPHFLNNALQSIGTVAIQQGQMNIYSLISSLGKMMRYHMHTSETFVPLSKELDCVKAYLELQRQRFEDQLETCISAGPDVLSIEIPKMTLQPIVENYFKHGYKSEAGAHIVIECEKTEAGWLKISVSDSGKGMEPDQLADLNLKLERRLGVNIEERETIGLVNVISRLKLYFGEHARIELANREPGGFQVVLWIPLPNGGVTA